MKLDETHDPALRSWVESANAPGCEFPIQNLPFAIFRRKGRKEAPRGGVAIGDQILDLAALGVRTGPTLNALAASGRPAQRKLRRELSRALREKSAQRKRLSRHLVPMRQAELLLPVAIGDYSDFYTGIHHATNIGRILRPDNPLLPNYKWVPIGYHGRGSSIVVSGTPIRRPPGQLKPADAPAPVYAPSKRLDYEVELGFLTGTGNRLGRPIPIGDARQHVFAAAQLDAHQTSNGCSLQPGDLVASGTLSGASADSLGSLMELTLAGKNPFALSSGETRAFLEDGDEVIERGRCAHDGYATIGFGEATGRILPAHAQ